MLIGRATYKGQEVPLLEKQKKMDVGGYYYSYLIGYGSEPRWVDEDDLSGIEIWRRANSLKFLEKFGEKAMKEKIEEAVKRIKGKEKLNDVLKDYPSDMKEEILKALRESKTASIQDLLSEVRIAKVAIFEAQRILVAKGAPAKVKEMARAVEKEQGLSPEASYRIAWETYCSYVNPDYEGCTSKGKSKRKSPKSER